MREVWQLPSEDELRKSGDEWVINILDNQTSNMRPKLLLLWWRAWHLHNDTMFGKGEASISNSVSFISNYLNTTTPIKNGWNEYDRKGKGKITYTPEPVANMCKSTNSPFVSWRNPSAGYTLLEKGLAVRSLVVAHPSSGAPLLYI
jgi:hypothetical protein